jgi:hypothetical protein
MARQVAQLTKAMASVRKDLNTSTINVAGSNNNAGAIVTNTGAIAAEAITARAAEQVNADAIAAEAITARAAEQVNADAIVTNTGAIAAEAITARAAEQVNADAIVTNTGAIATNSGKTCITATQANAITTNSGKMGITATQANAITTNSRKTGITATQANAITTNANAIIDASSVANTAKTTAESASVAANIAQNAANANTNTTTGIHRYAYPSYNETVLMNTLQVTGSKSSNSYLRNSSIEAYNVGRQFGTDLTNWSTGHGYWWTGYKYFAWKPGTYIVNMFDSFGDGWHGSTLHVYGTKASTVVVDKHFKPSDPGGGVYDKTANIHQAIFTVDVECTYGYIQRTECPNFRDRQL